MSKDDEYRKNAHHAQERADRATSSLDKEAWLRVAQGWLLLIRTAKPSEQELFDDNVKARGTGQESSDKSN